MKEPPPGTLLPGWYNSSLTQPRRNLMSTTFRLGALSGLSLLLLSACGGGDATVTAQLYSIAPLIRTPEVQNGSAPSRNINVNTAITIESLKVPIRSISLNTSVSGGGSEIYSCAADSNDACLVELVGTALQNLLTSAGAKTVSAGTYTHVQISTCKSEQVYQGKIIASGKTDPAGGGSTLYTQASSGTLTSNVLDKGAATVHFTGCSRTYPLPVPVTVTDKSTVNVKLYFDIRDIRDIAFFGDVGGGQAYYAGGYSFVYPAAPTSTYVGVNYLDVAGTIDSGTPTIERYRVTAAAGDIGTIGLIFTSGGSYIGGFSRSFFSVDTTQASNRFVTPIQTFTETSTGVYTLQNYGSSNTGSGYFNTTAFTRASASGVAFTDKDGNASTYASVRLAD